MGEVINMKLWSAQKRIKEDEKKFEEILNNLRNKKIALGLTKKK